MLLKINVGTRFFVNGKQYRVKSTSMEKVDFMGVSCKVSFVANAQDDPLDDIEIEFDEWTAAINENALTAVLTRG